MFWSHTKTFDVSDKHLKLKSKIANRKKYISAQDKFYDLPMIYHYLLSSRRGSRRGEARRSPAATPR
jgi:hypothetical protein